MINLTPHAIKVQLADGTVTVFEPSGTLARVSTLETVVGEYAGVPVVARTTGDVEGMPAEGTPCIVSAMVLAALPGRRGVFAPDTGSTAIRDDKCHIVAVTRLVAA